MLPHLADPTLLSIARRCQLLFHAPLSPLSNIALLPFLLLLPCLSFSLHRWLPIFLSLSTSNSEPIAARGCSPFFTPFFLCPAIFSFFSHFLPSLLLFSLLLYPGSPPIPINTAVSSLPRTDAAVKCNVTFIVPFPYFPLVSCFPLFLVSLSHLFSFPSCSLFFWILALWISFDKSKLITKRLSKDDKIDLSFSLFLFGAWCCPLFEPFDVASDISYIKCFMSGSKLSEQIEQFKVSCLH